MSPGFGNVGLARDGPATGWASILVGCWHGQAVPASDGKEGSSLTRKGTRVPGRHESSRGPDGPRLEVVAALVTLVAALIGLFTTLAAMHIV